MGEKEIPGNPVPVPVRVTDCGELGALSVKHKQVVRFPATCGLNVTFTVQVPAGATDVQLFVCEKEVELPPVI